MTEPEESPAAAGAPPGCPRWVRVTLAVSLALNLLVAGALIGGAIAHWRRPPPDGLAALRPFGIAPFARHLPAPERRRIGDALAAEAEAFAAARARLAEAGRALAEALRQPEADPERLARAFAELRAAGSALQAVSHEVLARELAALPLAERERLARAMERRLARPPRHRGRP